MKVARGQLFDLSAVDGRSVELPVEGGERVGVAEAGCADAVGDAAFATTVSLVAQEQVQELQVGEAFTRGAAEQGVELLVAQRHTQRGEVG